MGLVAPRQVEPSRTGDQIRVPCVGRRMLMHRATREVPAWWFWGTCARLCSIRTLALSRRHPPFSAASVNTPRLLRGPEVTEVWRPQGPDAPLGSPPHTLSLRGLGVPVGSLETVVTGGLGLPLGGVGNSQETPGPVTISRGGGGRWCWAVRGGTLEGGAPTKNKGDPPGGTSWAERTCKGEDGVCPGSSRTVRTQEPGEAGHIPDSMYRAGGPPKGREQVGVPSRNPAPINGGTDGGRTRVRFWIPLEHSGTRMSSLVLSFWSGCQ